MTDDVVELTDEEAEAKYVAGEEDPSLEDEEEIVAEDVVIGDHVLTPEQVEAAEAAVEALVVHTGMDKPDEPDEDLDDDPIDEADWADDDPVEEGDADE